MPEPSELPHRPRPARCAGATNGTTLIYCGIDWAEKTHDVALVDDTGQSLAKRHITDDAAGYKLLLELLAEYGDTEETPIPVAIET